MKNNNQGVTLSCLGFLSLVSRFAIQTRYNIADLGNLFILPMNCVMLTVI